MRKQNLSHVQFPFQLPMFLPTKQVMGEAPLLDQHDDETRAELMSNKLTEAMHPVEDVEDVHGAGVYDSMAQQGMRSPIEMVLHDHDGSGATSVAVSNGHHRLAAADALGHQEVPVQMSDQRYISMEDLGRDGSMKLGDYHTSYDALHAHEGKDEAIAAIKRGWTPRAVVPNDPRPYREVPSKFQNQPDSGDRWTWI